MGNSAQWPVANLKRQCPVNTGQVDQPVAKQYHNSNLNKQHNKNYKGLHN